MGKFSTEERDKLYALFTVDEHEIREGATSKDKKKISWFTYVRREAIIMRLDTLFFGEWESGFVNHATPYQYHQTHVDCAMYVTIRGMRREYNGSQDGGGLNGAKGAATDAFKRVASQWGIGLYLQQSPQIWTENYKDESGKPDWKKKDKVEAEAMSKVAAWLKQLGATGNAMKSDSDPVDDEPQAPQATPPASGNGNAGSGKQGDSKTIDLTEQMLMDYTIHMYKHAKHQEASFKSLRENGVLTNDMKPFTAACHVLMHRALTDYMMDADIVKEALGGSLKDHLASDGNSLVTAWNMITVFANSHKQTAN